MQKSKAGLFLMELLIALLFFSVAGAICLQLFVGAHNANKHSEQMSHASTLFSNYAEEFFNPHIIPEASNICYYTDTLNLSDASNSAYCVSTFVSAENDYTTMHITISNPDQSEIYIEQDLKKYERRTLKDVTTSQNKN